MLFWLSSSFTGLSVSFLLVLHHFLNLWAPGSVFGLSFFLHSLPWWSHSVSRLMSSKMKLSSSGFSPQLQTHISNYLHDISCRMSDSPHFTFLQQISWCLPTFLLRSVPPSVYSISLNDNVIILVFQAKNLRNSLSLSVSFFPPSLPLSLHTISANRIGSNFNNISRIWTLLTTSIAPWWSVSIHLIWITAVGF